MGLQLLIAALCVLANGFFVAAEFGLVKVRVTQLVARSRKGDARADRTLAIIKQLDWYLSAVQLGITLASLGLGWVGEPAVAHLFEVALRRFGFGSPELDMPGTGQHALLHGLAYTTAFITITTFHIVLGEQAPKILAIRRAEAVALAFSRPLRVFYAVVFPFLWVLGTLSRLTLKALRVQADDDSALSADEIRLIVAGGNIEPTKRELIERVMQGTDRPVRAIMVPRVDMATISLLDSRDEIMATARTTGYSRLPVIEGRDPDKIIGYIYVKDLILADSLPSGGIRALRRDVLFVPESRKVGDTLKDFQRTNIPIAIVVDEYGGTSGLVTVEDILEEIVGELQDEFDMEAPRIAKRDDGSVILDGMVATADLAALGIELEPIEGHDTVAGYIVAGLGRLARPGDVVRLGSYDATVEDVRRRRVTRVRLTHRAPTEPPAPVKEGPENGAGPTSTPTPVG